MNQDCSFFVDAGPAAVVRHGSDSFRKCVGEFELRLDDHPAVGGVAARQPHLPFSSKAMSFVCATVGQAASASKPRSASRQINAPRQSRAGRLGAESTAKRSTPSFRARIALPAALPLAQEILTCHLVGAMA